MHTSNILIYIFIFYVSFSHTMEHKNKDTLPLEKIGTMYTSIDDNHVRLSGSYLLGLEKILTWRQIGFQFAQRHIGQDYSMIITPFFNKNFTLSLFEIDSHGRYILCSHKNKLFIISTASNKQRKLKFPNSITALAVDSESEYFAVGQENGEVSLRGFKKKKCNLDFPRLHTSPIKTLQCGQATVVCCNDLGKNYEWRNIWSNKRHFISFNTKLPVIECKIGKKYIAFQHASNLIEFPRISLINKETKTLKKHFGTLIDITSNDELLIEQELTNLFCVSADGTILESYKLPKDCSIISNKKTGQPIPFVLKQEVNGEESSKSEFLMPIFNLK